MKSFVIFHLYEVFVDQRNQALRAERPKIFRLSQVPTTIKPFIVEASFTTLLSTMNHAFRAICMIFES